MTTEPGRERQSFTGCGQDRGNDLPVLHEIYHALEALRLQGVETTIDIYSLPFGSADARRLEDVLGTGEVRAVLDALGESRITETAFPGIWWVEHRNENGDLTARSLEVTHIPGILKSQREDVASACDRLGALLSVADAGTGTESTEPSGVNDDGSSISN